MGETAVEHRAAVIPDPSAAVLGADVLSKLGHELRSPLTGIVGLARILLMQLGTADPAQQARQLDMIQSTARRALATIERVADIAQVESGPAGGAPCEVDCRGIVAGTAAALASTAGAHGLRLRTDLPDRPVVVHADADLVSRILRELLDNAVRFAGSGEILVHVGADGDRPVIEVSDGGPGVPAADQARIFEAFERGELAAERDDDGAGLGLYLARKLADQLGARLSVRSRPGSTTFTVAFPAPGGAARAGRGHHPGS